MVLTGGSDVDDADTAANSHSGGHEMDAAAAEGNTSYNNRSRRSQKCTANL